MQLIDRNSRQLRLSSVGRDFFFKAKRLLDELDAAVLGIRELADQASGEVTIGAVPTATYYFLPRVIEDFNEVLTAGGSHGKLVSERSRPGSARSAFHAAQAASTTAS